MNQELQSAFPLPPSYYKDYTDENIAKWKAKDASAPNLDPPEPIKGPFVVFGQTDNVFLSY
jgi:hypothetical protein